VTKIAARSPRWRELIKKVWEVEPPHRSGIFDTRPRHWKSEFVLNKFLIM
jgi:hypothetical protein